MAIGVAAGAAVCIVVLILRWAFRFAARQQLVTGGRGNAGNVGTAAMLVAVVSGSAAAGAFFAARPEGEPYPRGAGVLLACSVLLVLAGVALKAGAARRPSIHIAGVRGRALVRSVRRADGKSIQGLPVFVIDMDASGPGIPSFRVVHHEAIPERMGETIRAGATWPILIEPATKRVVIDWVSPPPMFNEDVEEPPPRSVAPVVTAPIDEEDEPLAAAGSPSAGTRTIALVLVVVLLGTAASFVTALLDSDAPIEIVPDPAGDRPRVEAYFSSSETGFSSELPAGWTEEPVEEGVSLRSGAASIVVERAPRLERRLRGLDGTIPLLFRSVERDLGEIERAQPVFVGVDPARRYDLHARDGSKTTVVVIVRLERVYVARLVAPADEWMRAAGALDEVIDKWVWFQNY